jgi:hypothetical protein
MNIKRVVIFSVIAAVLIAATVVGYILYKESARASLEAYNKQYDVCYRFNLNYHTTILFNKEKQIVNISEGTYTALRIHNYNQWVMMKTLQSGDVENLDPRIRSIGDNGIITLENVLGNPEPFSAIWAEDGPMDDGDFSDVFFSEYIFVTEYNGKYNLTRDRMLFLEERAYFYEVYDLDEELTFW